ncbi:YqiA/YcfP family alpha/beta fold hydrolase [Lyngbya aestuarii]|uniref:YqiA/YcfP family alpha/beta fold hydrolase n=1 Tax=Lyngbya aestuarii TaxID=118322 RepID=UPI00403E1C21
MMQLSNYIYLHGFASGPQSAKAQFLYSCLEACQINLKIPDLNQGNFPHLTLTRQLQQVEAEFALGQVPVIMIGSSFGGLTAAWLGERHSQVQRLVLLAPAFGFLEHWLSKLPREQLQNWQASGYMPVHHYAQKRSLPLHYQFLEDARQYQDKQLSRAVPTLILHGRHDEVIPIQASRDYAGVRPWVQLVELESDHSLSNVMPEIWQATQAFCQLS